MLVCVPWNAPWAEGRCQPGVSVQPNNGLLRNWLFLPWRTFRVLWFGVLFLACQSGFRLIHLSGTFLLSLTLVESFTRFKGACSDPNPFKTTASQLWRIGEARLFQNLGPLLIIQYVDYLRYFHPLYKINRSKNSLLFQLTGTIKRKTSGKNEQVLDKLKVERERGITGSFNLYKC